MAQERLSMMRSVLSALAVGFQKKEQAGSFPSSVRADLKTARYKAE